MRKKGSFTDLLKELALAMVVLAIIAGVAFFWLSRDTDTSDTGICHTNQRRIEASALMYRARNDAWPDDIETLVEHERLNEVPVCPEEITYEMEFHNNDVTVTCPIHGHYREANNDTSGEDNDG